MTGEKKAQWPGWETTRLVGRGSFGVVYEIQRKLFEDEDEVEKAALKVISIPQNDSDIEEMYSDGYDEESVTSTFHTHLKSIVAEYSLMRKMNGSSNIVNCDDVRYVQHDDGIGWDIYIKMELLTPLTKALPATVSDEQVIKIAKDMCAALELCQKYNIIHRDIKPQNIFVSENGDYKLGDFGIAKTVEKTMGGTKTGTYKYMAPEVYSNRPYNSTADIYSLGLVLYWLLNERRMPFMPLPPEKLRPGMDDESRNRRFSGEKIPAPKNGSVALKQIVLKACAFDPKDRYQSAREMREDLVRLSGDHEPVQNAQDSAYAFVQEADYTDATIGPIFGQTSQKGQFDDAEKTVGPTFGYKVNAETSDEGKTVGPVFEFKVDATELDKTVGPKFMQNNINDKSESKREKKSKRKTRLLITIIVICMLLGATALAFSNGSSVLSGHSVEKIRAIKWINEIEQYRATHKTYELAELITLTKELSLTQNLGWESISLDNVIIRKHNFGNYVSIRVVYLDSSTGDVVYGDEYIVFADREADTDLPTYSKWLAASEHVRVQNIVSGSNVEYYWYRDRTKENNHYDLVYATEYIDGYAVETFLSKEFFDYFGIYANEISKSEEALTVAVSPDFAPMCFIDSTKTGQDQYVGYEISMVKYIADYLNRELIIVPMDYDDCDDAVSNGIVDLAIAGFAWTEERESNYNLSDYYCAGDNENTQILITLASNGDKYTTKKDLSGARIGVQTASVQQSIAETQLLDSELVTFTDLSTAVQKLMSGEFDCIAVSADTGDTIISKNSEIAKSGFIFYANPQETGNVILMQKGADDLTNVVNEALAHSMKHWDAWYENALSIYSGNNASDPSSKFIDLTLIYGGKKIQINADEWEARRTQIKTVDVSLPGTSKEYEFTGVTLKSLMETAGAFQCTQIVVRSYDGWEAAVDAADALKYDIMITDCYVGGREIPVDAGGPIKLVFPATEHPELNEKYDAWVWQWYVSEIEFH